MSNQTKAKVRVVLQMTTPAEGFSQPWILVGGGRYELLEMTNVQPRLNVSYSYGWGYIQFSQHRAGIFSSFYYDGLCTRVKDYQTASRKWREKLKRNYCSDPWKVTSWIVASILLLLTGAQTAYTITQYYSPPG